MYINIKKIHVSWNNVFQEKRAEVCLWNDNPLSPMEFNLWINMPSCLCLFLAKRRQNIFFFFYKNGIDPLLISLVRHLIDRACTSMIHLEFSWHQFCFWRLGILACEYRHYRGINRQIQPDLLLHVAAETDSVGAEGCLAPTQTSRSVLDVKSSGPLDRQENQYYC